MLHRSATTMPYKHARAVALLGSNRPIKYLIRDYFALPKEMALMPSLLARSLGQADLVLCLLRLRDTHRPLRMPIEIYITMLVGHPIEYGPGCLLRYRDNGAPHVSLDRSPRVTWVTDENPRQPNTDAYLRWPEYKVGRTIAQLKMRGVKTKDIRVAKRKGWIKLEQYA